MLPQLMCHLYRTDCWLFPSPHALFRGKELATSCDRCTKGQGERHRQHQENPAKTPLRTGKHSSSCLSSGGSNLWSCCYPGPDTRQAQSHQRWWRGGKQQVAASLWYKEARDDVAPHDYAVNSQAGWSVMSKGRWEKENRRDKWCLNVMAH